MLILLAIKRADHTMQRFIAASIGIEAATLTHHRNPMERAGLVTRPRPPDNRRDQTVALTPEGEAFFQRPRGSVVAFDRRLRTGLTDDQLDSLRGVLSHLRSTSPQAVVPELS